MEDEEAEFQRKKNIEKKICDNVEWEGGNLIIMFHKHIDILSWLFFWDINNLKIQMYEQGLCKCNIINREIFVVR